MILSSRSVDGVSGPFDFAYVSTGDVYALAIAIPILAIAAVGLRFFVRKDRKVGLGLDDWMLVPALAAYVGLCIILLIGASHNLIGSGVTSPLDLTPPNPLHDYVIPLGSTFAKLQFSFQLLLVIANCFIKLSTICLYQRIFATQRNGTFNIFCHGSHLLVILWTLTFFLLAILACPSDPSAQWSSNPLVQNARCTVAFSAGEALTITDFLLDIWLIALPQPLIWRLQMALSKKLMLSAIIVLALSCVGFSAARIALFAEIRDAAHVAEPLDRNQVVSVNVWFAALDAGMGLIACCLPPLRPLIRDLSVEKIITALSGATLVDDGDEGKSGRRSKRLSDRLWLHNLDRDKSDGERSAKLLASPRTPKTPSDPKRAKWSSPRLS